MTAIESSGANAIAVGADVASLTDLDQLFAVALDRFGRLDIVAANAGVELTDQSIVDFTETDFDRLFSINAKGALFTLQRAVEL